MRAFSFVLALLVACGNTSSAGSGSAGGSDGGSGSGGAGPSDGGSGSAIDVRVTVSGSGRVTSTPAGIDCGSTCSAAFASGAAVALAATPAAGWRFAGWSGSCSGTAGCQIALASAAVTATFEQLPPPPPGSHALSVARAGSGSGYVSSAPGGIDCGGTCTASFAAGTSVTLTATGDNGSTFTGWSGGCSGAGACTVSMSADVVVSASFDSQPPPPPPPPADDCAGLVPAAPGSPLVMKLTNQDLVYGSCEHGESDGTGHITTLWQDGYQPHSSSYTFFDSTGAQAGTGGGIRLGLIGQASGFMGAECQGGACFFDYLVVDPAGHQLYKSATSGTTNGAQANDPTGGMVVQRYKDSSQTTMMVVAMDAAGQIRWERQIPATFSGYQTAIALGVDRQGNVLALFPTAGTWQGPWGGQWWDHAGNAVGGVFTAPRATELFERVDNGLFLSSSGIWVGQIEPQAQTVAPAPAWLRQNMRLHMVHGGTGYAMMPEPGAASVCEQRVDIVSRSGKTCGTADFAMAPGACTTSTIRVGYDGTVIQQLSRDLEAACTAAGHYCDCTYRAWPGYFH